MKKHKNSTVGAVLRGFPTISVLHDVISLITICNSSSVRDS
jgi:hypothetical protein